VLDAEIACVDDHGRPNFRDLLFRKRQCIFVALDLLYLNGKDLRVLPLIERKAMLTRLLRRKRSRILYLDHVETDGCLLFEEIVTMGPGRHRLQAKGLAVQGDREAVAVLDQGEELALFAGGRARGVVRAGNTKTKGSRNERRTIALLESAGYCCIKAGLISLGGLTKRRPTRKLMPQWLATSSIPLPNCRTSFLCTLRLYWRLNG